MTMDIEDVADEIRCVYPHITRGYLKEEQALILRAYYQPLKNVGTKYWPDILRVFHRLSQYVRPANMYLAIEEVVGRDYPVKRPQPQKTQHTAFEEMQINESQDRRWERKRREWVQAKIDEEIPGSLGIVEASMPTVPKRHVSNHRSKTKVVAMRRVP